MIKISFNNKCFIVTRITTPHLNPWTRCDCSYNHDHGPFKAYSSALQVYGRLVINSFEVNDAQGIFSYITL